MEAVDYLLCMLVVVGKDDGLTYDTAILDAETVLHEVLQYAVDGVDIKEVLVYL